MGDQVELQITPETPGRPSIRNPFESPSDYHHLREPLVPSPTVFKSKSCKATPPRFNWSIEEMASLAPVHIDPEEIQRQSFYLSQTRADSDVEEKFQNAIEQFFTKGTIVPSPWAAPEARRAPQVYKKSPLSETTEKQTEKISVACQTVLSLPLAFDLEKLLGEYYRYEEACDAVQESLSSSSLRRKLFLDGQFSYSSSDSSTPPSPERVHTRAEKPSANREGGAGENASPAFSSPLSCGKSAPTPSSGQFSSSPIQSGRFRDCSIGSPLFPDRSSPANQASPTVSPILPHSAHTPTGSAERRHVTPHGTPLDVDVNESPFVEGCSPIRSCSPHQLHFQKEAQRVSRAKFRPRVNIWASPPPISPILDPESQDENEEQSPFPSPMSPVPSMEYDSSSPVVQDAHPAGHNQVCPDATEHTKMEEDKELGTDRRPEEDDDDDDDEGEGASERLTSSRMGTVSGSESCQMFLSLLAESSSIRYDSSMQVDSGYNTNLTGAASLIDGLSSDFQSKESLNSNLVEDSFPAIRHTKIKALYSHH